MTKTTTTTEYFDENGNLTSREVEVIEEDHDIDQNLKLFPDPDEKTETPLDLIKQGVRDALNETYRNKESGYRFIANINDRTLFDEVIRKKVPQLRIKNSTLYYGDDAIGFVESFGGDSDGIRIELIPYKAIDWDD